MPLTEKLKKKEHFFFFFAAMSDHRRQVSKQKSYTLYLLDSCFNSIVMNC